MKPTVAVDQTWQHATDKRRIAKVLRVADGTVTYRTEAGKQLSQPREDFTTRFTLLYADRAAEDAAALARARDFVEHVLAPLSEQFQGPLGAMARRDVADFRRDLARW